VEWVSRRVEKTSFGDRIARNLARADMKFKVGEYFVLIIVTILVGGLVSWFLGNRHPVSALIGGVIGAFAPGFYVNSQQKKRLQKFNDQLSDMLNLMVNGLRAGYSTMQAMEAISKELPSPICDEFRRVIQEMQIGIPMESALDNLLRRIPSQDLDFVVTAINVQREVGGNLSEILDNISFTIRERVRIKGEVRVLTSQCALPAPCFP
jgi:tight adherence protein B